MLVVVVFLIGTALAIGGAPTDQRGIAFVGCVLMVAAFAGSEFVNTGGRDD
jgi:hypothetical protein